MIAKINIKLTEIQNDLNFIKKSLFVITKHENEKTFSVKLNYIEIFLSVVYLELDPLYTF